MIEEREESDEALQLQYLVRGPTFELPLSGIQCRNADSIYGANVYLSWYLRCFTNLRVL